MNEMTQQTVVIESDRPVEPVAWKEIVAKYEKPALGAVFGKSSTPRAVCGALVFDVLEHDGVVLADAAAHHFDGGFLVRVFIIHHDCGHGSYFKSRKANDIMGFITGVLAFTPYYLWRWEHAIHHASSGDLDGAARAMCGR